MKKLLLALPLLLWNSACSASSIFSLTPTPTNYVYPTPETPAIPALTVEALGDAVYTLPSFDGAIRSFQFTDGKYALGDPSVSGHASLSLLDFFAFGDLNADGVSDAAALIAENYDGRVLVSVNAALNEGGLPRHAASFMIDERPKINALEIRDGEIFLDALIHGLDDPACCPELSVTRSFRLIGDSLTLVRASTRLPSGQERLITIESPADGAEASGELMITGSVTIAPFENALTCRVYNEQGNELFAGPIMVNAPDFGAAGAFTVTLDAGRFPPGRVRIVIAELSAADGSILALASVEINVK